MFDKINVNVSVDTEIGDIMKTPLHEVKSPLDRLIDRIDKLIELLTKPVEEPIVLPDDAFLHPLEMPQKKKRKKNLTKQKK